MISHIPEKLNVQDIVVADNGELGVIVAVTAPKSDNPIYTFFGKSSMLSGRGERFKKWSLAPVLRCLNFSPVRIGFNEPDSL